MVRYRALLADALLLAVAVAVTALSLPANGTDWDAAWLSGSALATLALLAQYGFYRRRFSPLFLDEVRLLIGASAVAVMGSTFIRVLLFDHGDAADVAARGWAVALAMLVVGHAAQRAWAMRTHRLGRSGEPTMIVGAGEIGSRVARRLLDRGDLGLRPVVFLDDDPLETAGRPDIPVLPAPEEGAGDLIPRLRRIANEYAVTHVVLTFSNRTDLEQLELLRACQDIGLTVSVIPRLFEGVPDRTTLERLGGLPMIAVHPANPHGLQFAMKYAMDRAVAALLIILVSPVVVVATVGTLITLGRPVLFRQRRVGRDGREFEMLKFRTMLNEAQDGEVNGSGGLGMVEAAKIDEAVDDDIAPGGIEGDDRRTRFGSFLRHASIDELPQLFNVLWGDMSLVGPRPERVEFARRFGIEVPRYADRERVKSGITGWAQVNGLRGRTSLADRVEWDNYYIENWSLWFDLRILMLSMTAVFRHDGDK